MRRGSCSLSLEPTASSFESVTGVLLHLLILSIVQFDLNLDLMTFFLNLLVRYTQILLLVEQVADPLTYLPAYAKSFHLTTGNTESNFNRIAGFIARFKEPIKRLREDFGSSISLAVGNALLSLLPLAMKWSTGDALLAQKVFSVHDDIRLLNTPVGEKSHVELYHLDRVHQWVLFGFMLCPNELQRPGAVQLLVLSLSTELQLVIYRDRVRLWGSCQYPFLDPLVSCAVP